MRKWFCFTILCLQISGCSSREVIQEKSVNMAPFQYAGRYLIKIPVTVNDTKTHFIFDTGIGVNLLSQRLCNQFGCKITSSHTGHRMTGQKLTIPMSTLASLSFAGKTLKNIPVGIWEMKGFLPSDADCQDVEGFLSLGFFRDQAFTMDYKTGQFILENEESLKARRAAGHVIPIDIDEDGPAITIFMPLKLSDGSVLKVEIDLGGNILTLNEKYMSKLGVAKKSKSTLVEKQTDETGHSNVRYYSKIQGPISPVAAPTLQQSDLDVMFQNIIYDGLIANDFMKRFTVTYDLPNSQIILANPAK